MQTTARLLQYSRINIATSSIRVTFENAPRRVASLRSAARCGVWRIFLFFPFLFPFLRAWPLFRPIDDNAHNSRAFRFLSSVVSAFRSLFDANERFVSIRKFKPRVEAAGNKTRQTGESQREEWFEFRLFLQQFPRGHARESITACLKSHYERVIDPVQQHFARTETRLTGSNVKKEDISCCHI